MGFARTALSVTQEIPKENPIRYLDTLLHSKRVNRVSNLTLDWLQRHASHFRPSEDQQSIAWRVKPLIELMTLLTTLANHDIRSKKLSKLTQRALEYGAEFEWHELAAYDASAATVLAVVAEFFWTHQKTPPFDLKFIHFLHEIGFFEGIDRVPYREMDMSYSLGLMISKEFRKDLPAWFASTTFGQRQHLTRYTVDDIYAVTHAVFYLANFGSGDIAELLAPETADKLRRDVVALTVMVLRTDNIDVLGELLLCWLFCRVENTAFHRMIFHQAMERLLSATTARGESFPTVKLLQSTEAGEGKFAEVYHTTLVCGMLFGLAAEEMPYVH